MNEPVMNTDPAKLAAMAASMGETLQMGPEEMIRDVLFPMINGLRDAVTRLAMEFDGHLRDGGSAAE